jgi:hypothetical protein
MEWMELQISDCGIWILNWNLKPNSRNLCYPLIRYSMTPTLQRAVYLQLGGANARILKL